LIDYLYERIQAHNFLLLLRRKGDLLISTVNIVEIYFSKDIKNKKKRKIINSFLNTFTIINLNQDITKQAGLIRLNYHIPFADAIIAAAYIKSGAKLITRNIKYFNKINDLKIKTYST